MTEQNLILSRIFVDFDDILSRYQRFNLLFFNNIQDQISNNSKAREFIKQYQKVSQNSNKQTEQILNLEPNNNNLLIAEANLPYIFKLLKKHKKELFYSSFLCCRFYS